MSFVVPTWLTPGWTTLCRSRKPWTWVPSWRQIAQTSKWSTRQMGRGRRIRTGRLLTNVQNPPRCHTVSMVSSIPSTRPLTPAVVVHLGTMVAGHYIAYVLVDPERMFATDDAAEQMSQLAIDPPRPDRRVWCYCSDTEIRLASVEEVLAARAYLCFVSDRKDNHITDNNSTRKCRFGHTRSYDQ